MPSARANAAATQARGLAEGEAVRAKGGRGRGDQGVAENQDSVIRQQLAEKWPEIVEAAARPLGDIDQMIVLNGAQGLSEGLAQAMSQGVAGLQLARSLLAGAGGEGRPTDGKVAAASPTTPRPERAGS